MTVEMSLSGIYRKEASSKKGYKRSYVVRDVQSKSQLAYCDLCSYVESSPVPIVDADGREFILTPNRKIMPSKWILTDCDSVPVYEIERASAAKILNPLGRKLLTVRCLSEKKEYELHHLAKNKLDLMSAPSTFDWYLLEGEVAVAGLECRKGESNAESGKGFLSKLKSFLQPSSWILVTHSDSHLISASAFIAMMMLYHAITRPSE